MKRGGCVCFGVVASWAHMYFESSDCAALVISSCSAPKRRRRRRNNRRSTCLLPWRQTASGSTTTRRTCASRSSWPRTSPGSTNVCRSSVTPSSSSLACRRNTTCRQFLSIPWRSIRRDRRTTTDCPICATSQDSTCPCQRSWRAELLLCYR